MRNHRMLRLAGICIVALLPVAAAAEEYGGCFRVDLASPFILPDGSTHAPGALTICTERPFSPVAGTHRMVASGASAGRIVSRRVPTEIERLDVPQVVFARSADGALRLMGYVEPAGDVVRAFSFAKPEGSPAFGAAPRNGWVVIAGR